MRKREGRHNGTPRAAGRARPARCSHVSFIKFYSQSSGLKSKRFTKEMLAQMRRAGALRTVPRVNGKSYGYALAEETGKRR